MIIMFRNDPKINFDNGLVRIKVPIKLENLTGELKVRFDAFLNKEYERFRLEEEKQC